MAKRIYRDHRWEPLRRTALERAGYRCQSCGRPGRLEAHHKIPLRVAPELAFELRNLEVRCRKCHFAVHKKLKVPAERAAWLELVEGLGYAGV